MKKTKAENKKPFSVRELGEPTIIATKRRAIDEGRTMSAVVSDALLAYLATPLPRAQRSA